jgi:peptide deformylase
VQYQTIDGIEKVLSAEGLMAICLQHEMDHLDGTLFIDRLSTLKKDFAKKKLLRARKEREE